MLTGEREREREREREMAKHRGEFAINLGVS